MAASLSPALQARLAERGVELLSTERALQLLEMCLSRPEAHLLAAQFNLQKLGRSFGAEIPAVWQSLIRPSASSAPAKSAWAEELAKLPASQRLSYAQQTVRSELSLVLSLHGPEAVPLDAPLKDLGLDSLTALELRNALSKKTGITLPATIELERTAADDVAKHVLSRSTNAHGSAVPKALRESAAATFHRLNSLEAPRARLFCFHQAAGSGDSFQPLVRLERAGIEVHTISISRELPVEEVAEDYVRDVRRYIDQKASAPYGLLGHSTGGLIAWEIAMDLQHSGRGPCLFAPCAIPPPLEGESSFIDTNKVLSGLFGERGAQMPHLRASFDYDVQLLRSLQAHRKGSGSRLSLHCEAFYGERDPLVEAAAVQAWSNVIEGSFRATALPTDHDIFSNEQAVEIVVQALARALVTKC